MISELLTSSRSRYLLATGMLITVLTSSLATAQPEHFDSKGNPPSTSTIALQEALRESLPFEDERDFEESQRGFIAAPDYQQITAANGRVVWDMARYDFLRDGTDYDSIHPSLQRQAVLNLNYGLYEVVPDLIYQVRGFDLSNMTLMMLSLIHI